MRDRVRHLVRASPGPLLLVATALSAAFAATPAPPGEGPSAEEQKQLFERVCAARGEEAPTSFERDDQGWLCASPELAPEEGPSPFSPDLSELRWEGAWRGRFVRGDGEWLVSLRGRCILGCPGVSFVLERDASGWGVLGEYEGLLPSDCAVLHGAPDGRDRVACLGSAGPYQGGMSVWLEVRGFGAAASARRLLEKDQGGECFLAQPPEKAEYDGDRISELTAGEAGSGAAFSARLEVRRRECDSTIEDPEEGLETSEIHALRFEWQGDEVVGDPATAALLERFGWN